jgi:hypothetical protein
MDLDIVDISRYYVTWFQVANPLNAINNAFITSDIVSLLTLLVAVPTLTPFDYQSDYERL